MNLKRQKADRKKKQRWIKDMNSQEKYEQMLNLGGIFKKLI